MAGSQVDTDVAGGVLGKAFVANAVEASGSVGTRGVVLAAIDTGGALVEVSALLAVSVEASVADAAEAAVEVVAGSVDVAVG